MRRKFLGFGVGALLAALTVPACLPGQSANVGAEDPEEESGGGGDTGGNGSKGGSGGTVAAGGTPGTGATAGNGGNATGGQGGECTPGSTRRADCNTCYCSDDARWFCTTIDCTPRCEPGSQVPSPDGCNWCHCLDDGTVGSCTEKKCAECINDLTFKENCVNEPRYAREPATLTCCFYADECDAPEAWGKFATFEECMAYGRICRPGNADCDNDASNGCETILDFDENHCGSCGFRCDVRPPHGSPVCEYGSCDYICDDGWVDCNASRTDGCETPGNACDL